jgi:hypothetical protein
MMGVLIRALQYLFVFHKQIYTMKKKKAWNPNLLNSPVTKHWTPLYQTPHIFPIHTELNNFYYIGSNRWGGNKYYWNFRKKGTTCEDLTSFESLKCLLTNLYLPYFAFKYTLLRIQRYPYCIAIIIVGPIKHIK